MQGFTDREIKLLRCAVLTEILRLEENKVKNEAIIEEYEQVADKLDSEFIKRKKQ